MPKTKILIIFLIGLSVPFYVFWEIFFSVDSVYSSIGEPQSGIKITEQKIAGKDLIVLPEEGLALFDVVKLNIETQNNQKNLQNIGIKAYHNYLVAFYPISDKTLNAEELKTLVFQNNKTDLAIGTLFVNDDSVSVILPDNSFKSVFNAELFEKMEYQWEDVLNKETGFASSLEEKQVFRYGQPHPDGTFIERGNQKYLVWQEQLIPIKEDVDVREISLAPIVKISNILAEAFDSCSTESRKSKVSCKFEKELDLDKSNYVFEVDNFNQELIKEIKIKLSTKITKKAVENNFRITASDIKAKLIKQYGNYVPFF